GIRDGHVTGVQTCALPISAASAEVHPAGRSAFEFRLKKAPPTAFQLAPLFTGDAEKSSYSFQLSRSMMMTCRSPVPFDPPSMGEIGRASCRERVQGSR